MTRPRVYRCPPEYFAAEVLPPEHLPAWRRLLPTVRQIEDALIPHKRDWHLVYYLTQRGCEPPRALGLASRRDDAEAEALDADRQPKEDAR